MNNELHNSLEYLKQKVGETSGFSIPKNYFNELESRIYFTIFKKKTRHKKSFSTPDNYFNNLEDIIINKVSENKETKVISLKKYWVYKIPYAAAIAVLLMISISYFYNFNKDDGYIADSEIENWLLDNTSSYSLQEIAYSSISENLQDNDFSFTELNTSSIEDYIITTENTSILNELD